VDAHDWVLIIGAVFLGICQVLNVILSWLNKRQIGEVHKATNSLTDRLVESTAKESYAAGRKDEKDASVR
jgi:hypothetical protein